MKTTLNKIRAHEPCTNGWTKLLRHLGKTHADDDPLSLITVLDSNGIDDALWCLRAVDGHDREMRLFAVWCARQVRHLMTDPRSVSALDVAERFANGEASQIELDAALGAARDAARDLAWDVAAARDAARCATWAAVAAAAAAAAAAEATEWAAAAADRAAAAADAAARAAQSTEFRRVCKCVEAGVDPYPRKVTA